MQTRFILTLVVGTMILSACASEPPTGAEAGRALLDEVAASMGGWDVLSLIERQELITQGNDWEPLQAVEPGADLRINGFGRAIQIDFSGPSIRMEFDGERSYPNPALVRFTEVIDGDVGAVLGEDADGEPTASRMHGSRFATRLRDFNRLASRLLFVARDSGDLMRVEDRVVDEVTFEVLQYTDGANPVEVLISPFNKLPNRVTYTETDPLYGDLENALVYTDWRSSQVSATETGDPISARLPFGLATYVDGQRLREEGFRNIINNGTFEESAFDIPQEVRDEPEVGERVVAQWGLRRVVMGFGEGGFADGPQVATLNEVAPGVIHAVGGGHHSMIVEMEDHLIVVEVPLSEERSLAVIDAIEERLPDKPIRYAVVTHFHIDHAGGVRTYAAKGATIIAHESIVDFLTAALARPSTLRPDSLAQASVTPTVEGVSDSMDLTDGTRTVRVLHLPNDHATGMVVAYLPNEEIVFVSDLYSPPGPIQSDNPNAMAFYDAITEAGLSVSQVVGGHGTVGPLPTPGG